MRRILAMGAVEIARRVRAGEILAEEVLDAHLTRIAGAEPAVRAFVTIAEARARDAARRADSAVRAGGDPGALAGVPVAVKDNISTRGLRTTCASRILEDFVPTFDATAVRKIEAAGALLIGKTNLDEFGMGSSTENSAFGPTMNPWDPGRVPGGSSGGSAAAVASGMASAALGSDTGGSVRQPGGFCGLVGLKPHYGHVSRWGLVAFASSCDQIGVLARDAADCALLWNVIRGRDARDATSLPDPDAITPRDLDRPAQGIRLGLPREWLGDGVDPEVRVSLDRAAEAFRGCGARVLDVALPDPRYAIAAYHVIANAEASSNLARFDGVRYGRRSGACGGIDELYERSRGEGFGLEVKRRILLGTFVLSSGYYDAYYLKARRVRDHLRACYEELLRGIDAILLPTSPTPAFRLGEKAGDPLAMYHADLFTILSNLVAAPAVSFPGAPASGGLPIGLQLCGRPRDEATLLALVRAHERAHGDAGSVRGGAGPATAAPGPCGPAAPREA